MNTNRGDPIFKLLNDRLDEYVTKKPLEWKEWCDQYALRIKKWRQTDTEYLSLHADKLKNNVIDPVVPISIRNHHNDIEYAIEIKIDNGYSSIKYINNSNGLSNTDYILYRSYSQGGSFNSLPQTIPYNTIRRMLFEIFGVISNDTNKMTIMTQRYWNI